MTLPELRLDHLTWADLIAQARSRIPAESEGRWTLHAPVDPGITLLELYAWLLEQRLYLLDQIPDALVREVLALLGVAGPRPASPARTVLVLHATGPQAPAVVAAGSELTRLVGGAVVVLTTDQEVALIPVERWRLRAGGADRTADVARPGGAVLLPADGGPGEAELLLDLPAAFAPPAGARISLLLDLDVPDRIAPSWAAAEADVPPPAEVRWSYSNSTTAGSAEPFEAADVEDGTGGLRRPGLVRLRWPDAWRPAAGAAPAGTVTHRLVIGVERATFSSPPRLRRFGVNATAARHRRRVVLDGARLEALDRLLGGWLPLPGLTLELPGARGQLLDDPATLSLTLAERDGAVHDWHASGDLTVHGPGERVFSIDRERGVLRFGDGRTGRIPVPAPPTDPRRPRLAVTYELGGGTAGNLGSGCAWEAAARASVAAENPVPLDGGSEPEMVAQARARAADELRRTDRAVTIPDFETIVGSTPGVAIARSHVAVGHHPAAPCDQVPGAVTVFVVPDVPRDDQVAGPFVAAPQPDPGALQAVRARLEAARLLGAEVFVAGPRYRRVCLDVTVAAGVADPAGVRRRLLDGLAAYLDPLVGGEDGAGWPFGAPLRPSDLLGQAQRLGGRAATVQRVGIALDGGQRFSDCDDVVIAPYELVVLDQLTVHAVSVPPSQRPEGLQ